MNSYNISENNDNSLKNIDTLDYSNPNLKRSKINPSGGKYKQTLKLGKKRKIQIAKKKQNKTKKTNKQNRRTKYSKNK